jgi:uncharacterized membrane protein
LAQLIQAKLSHKKFWLKLAQALLSKNKPKLISSSVFACKVVKKKKELIVLAFFIYQVAETYNKK